MSALDVIISLQDVTKVFNNQVGQAPRTVLEQISLDVRRGETFGLLGPNGAGKTTLQKILLGLVRPTSGTAMVLGTRAGESDARARLGYLPENPYFYTHLTGREFVEFCGSLFGQGGPELRNRVDRLLARVGMTHARDLQLRKYSKGMLQRVGVAQALVNDPELVFLDEPMSGLDPVGRRELREIILELKSEGKTIFFNSHILSDVEALCERVGILSRGKLVSYGSVKDLTRQGSLEDAFVAAVQAEASA
ncbi:MAG: ABC transporter ATP-binding protein [bacterium]|jgi:ABC-2 type transport system ATP-binding protein|nr:ABC transporter ATP-binding protein [bacterium]